MTIERLAATLPLYSWLRDHHFAGQAVLPMVEAIGFLTALIAEKFPEIDVTRLNNANFHKLLILPEKDVLPVLIEIERLDKKRLRAALLTRKTGNISRLLHHAEIFFGGREERPAREQSPPDNGSGRRRVIACEKIYAELVPFGQSYRALHGKLHLRGNTASGTLIAPDLPLSCPALPHPFLLDGAMHAACVHGQSFCGFIPFPVAFAAMDVKNAHRLQKSGHIYHTHCSLLAATKSELRYDLRVWGDGGVIDLSGLVMKDVSGGAIKPPAWIGRNEVDI